MSKRLFTSTLAFVGLAFVTFGACVFSTPVSCVHLRAARVTSTVFASAPVTPSKSSILKADGLASASPVFTSARFVRS